MPPVKEAALRLGFPVYQPERVRRPEAVEQLRAMAPEAMVVVGYGQIIPQAILDIPPRGIINVHASLLPKYRGAAPIQWAIARGETRTGVTTMRIDAGLDTGDMLLKWETEIGPEETAVELGARLAEAGADLLVRTLAELAQYPAGAAGRCAGHLRADSQERRRPHRLAASGERDPQPGARVRAVAGRVTALRGQRCTSGKAAQRRCSKLPPGALRAVDRQIVCRVRRRAIDRIAGSSVGRERNGCGAAFLNGLTLETDEVLAMSLPLGFRYAATYAGIRKVAKDDLALIVSDTPAAAAAVFTRIACWRRR